MNRNAKKIEKALEKLTWIERISDSIDEVRNILCDHNEKEYQAEERENNISESLHCVDCNKEFDVQDEQEAQLENERD